MPIKFKLGRTVATPGALAEFEASGESWAHYMTRHAAGDWGDVCAADARANEQALKEGTRLLSAYRLRSGVKIWIITEADRSSTCILLPGEY